LREDPCNTIGVNLKSSSRIKSWKVKKIFGNKCPRYDHPKTKQNIGFSTENLGGKVLFLIWRWALIPWALSPHFFTFGLLDYFRFLCSTLCSQTTVVCKYSAFSAINFVAKTKLKSPMRRGFKSHLSINWISMLNYLCKFEVSSQFSLCINSFQTWP
jgi:hypothetical protein